MGSAPQRSPDSFDSGSPLAGTSKSRPGNESSDQSAENGSASFHELRHLILAPEQEALGRLNKRIENPESRTEDVSHVVAEAIQRRREQGGSDALSEALAPTIETALRESVRRDPGTLADALFPVMGPAIRRSILETLRSFLDSFNQVLDQSLSWQGMKWRIEALRTSRPFTEVALLHSLVFRVEQVFLIHKETGLPIGHAVAPAVAMQDPSLVSSMLSAIQNFVRDSFHTGQDQGVNRLNVGDLDVWVENGPYAILAAVIRGVGPRALRERMAETLENIHAELAGQLERFDGDTAPFEAVNKQLALCLASKFREEPKSRSYAYAWAAGVLLFALVGGLLGWRWWQYHRWSELAATLGGQPGLVITSFSHEHGRFVIRGLRDPLAPDPEKFVTDARLDSASAEFHWGSYYALDDALVQQRATIALAPPSGASLSVHDGVLRVAGQPTSKWLADVRARALFIPGVRAVDFGSFTPEQAAFDETKSRLEAAVVKFPLSSAALSPAERASLSNLMPQLKEVLNAPVWLHGSVTLEITGHSDNSGAEALNENLSQKRADRVAWELIQLGIPDGSLHAKGVGTAQPVRPEDSEENRQYNRSATFRVLIAGSPRP